MAKPYFVGIGFVAMGIYLFLWIRKRKHIATEAAGWPRVEGVIVESRVSHARPNSDESDFLSLVYRYEVGGTQYASSSIDLFGLESRISKDEMERFAKAYPVGRKIDVYYDVSSPTRSAIEPANFTAYKRLRNLGIFVISVGALFLLMASKFQ